MSPLFVHDLTVDLDSLLNTRIRIRRTRVIMVEEPAYLVELGTLTGGDATA